MDQPTKNTIRVGEATIGLLGLDVALNRALEKKMPDEEAVPFLFEAVSGRNYIPVGIADLYREALLNTYRKYSRSEAGKHHDLTIRILGPGCVSCRSLKNLLIDILQRLNLAADLEDIHELDEIWRYGVTSTPALIINDTVKSAGYLPTSSQIEQWLREAIDKG